MDGLPSLQDDMSWEALRGLAECSFWMLKTKKSMVWKSFERTILDVNFGSVDLGG